MAVAELRIFHSRHPSATRRVSPDPVDVSEPGRGDAALFLAAAVLAANAVDLEAPDVDAAIVLAAELSGGTRPRRALRHRVQDDRHGLDMSVHRLDVTEYGWVADLDHHGHHAPQIVGALMACAAVGRSSTGRRSLDVARLVIERAASGGFATMDELHRDVGTLLFDGAAAKVCGNGHEWAARTLGIDLAGIERGGGAGVQRAYRSAVRAAHPDHGAADDGAAERLMALQRARNLLMSSY